MATSDTVAKPAASNMSERTQGTRAERSNRREQDDVDAGLPQTSTGGRSGIQPNFGEGIRLGWGRKGEPARRL